MYSMQGVIKLLLPIVRSIVTKLLVVAKLGKIFIFIFARYLITLFKGKEVSCVGSHGNPNQLAT